MSSFMKKIKNRDVIFNVFRVIAITLTNDKKNLKKIWKIYI